MIERRVTERARSAGTTRRGGTVARPSLERREYQRRRARLAEMMGHDAIAILPAAPVAYRNRDIEFAYRQDSDFLYLTGFPEPEAVAVLLPERNHGDFLLFCRERGADSELLVGVHAGLDDACTVFGADDAFPIADLDDILPGLMEARRRVFYSMGSNPEFDHRMLSWINQMRHQAGRATPIEFVALDHLLHDMRLYKSAGEIRLMRRALEVTANAHARAMGVCRAGMPEYELEAELLYEMHRRGCRSPAYPSIVAGGTNACALHYTANSGVLAGGDLVLIDAGAEYEYYASDVTRTFPVSGRFTTPQRELYEVVLRAQLAAIDAVRPGGRWSDPHERAVSVLTQGLVDLGLLEGDLAGLVESGSYERFYMHPTGHWLGLDVHDVGDYQVGGAPRMLEPGMALTIAPGVYVAPDDDSVDEVWRGIGNRIEDDVLVTREGGEVVSADIPKHVSVLEDVVGAGGS